MTDRRNGVSVVIPTGGDRRLHLLDATLAGMRRSEGISQIILAEYGNRPCALELARRWDTDHVFSKEPGPFNRSRALNMGSKLAKRDIVLWCDGDAIFDPQFIPRAESEIRKRKLDFLLPFSTIHALREEDTAAVIAGYRDPESCPNYGYYGSFHPGFMGMVTAQFLEEHGGMTETFHGWGCEDEAWVHKVKVLGNVGWSESKEQKTWHLFHPQSTRDLSNIDGNSLLLKNMLSINDPAKLKRSFPSETKQAPPWQRSNRIAFVAVEKPATHRATKLAQSWSKQLEDHYDVAPTSLRTDPAHITNFSAKSGIDMFVVFAKTREDIEAMLLQLQGKAAIIVMMSKAIACETNQPVLQDHQPHWLLPRTARQAALWHETDSRIWHRHWETGEAKTQAAPTLVQLLSLALATEKHWSVKIELDRSALPAPALDRSPFWYVAVQDAQGNELSRCDAELDELTRLTTSRSNAFTLERTVPSAQRPARWVVQPTDRHRNWLERMEGCVDHATVNKVEVCY